MIHYITSHGIGNAWVAAELQRMQKKGIPFVLHSLYAPHQNFFGSSWAAKLNAQTRLLYPLPPLGLFLSLLLAPWLFGMAFCSGVKNALFGPRESWWIRARTLAHFFVACHWARMLRKEKVTLIHAQWANSPASVGMYAGRLLRVPFSFTGHGADLFRDRTALVDKVRQAEFIVCISEFHRQLYLSLGARPEQLHLVYCGIDVEEFAYVDRLRQARQILTVGRLVEKKGVPVLLDACALLRDRQVPFHLVIAGSGPQSGFLRERIDALGLTDQVTMTGQAVPQEHLPELLASADVYAQPCIWSSDNDVDGTPRTLMEAMASGLPCIASRIAGLPELIDGGQAGLLVEPGNGEELAKALEVFLTNPATARRHGHLARAFVARTFSIDDCLEPLATLFRKYLQGRHSSCVESRQPERNLVENLA